MLIILPHQLYEIKIIKHVLKENNIDKIMIWEHPHYFKAYNYNKKKLLLHRASMKYYYDYLAASLNKDILKSMEYVDFYKDINKVLDTAKYRSVGGFCMFDPIDKINLYKDSPRLALNCVKKLESPNFMITQARMRDYRHKTNKFFFHYFYTYHKQELNIIPQIKSKDKFNRKRLNDKVKIPKPFPRLSHHVKRDHITNSPYIKEAIKYVEKYFPKNYGNTKNFRFPITHLDAKRMLRHFIKYKFKLFGPYQDHIDSRITSDDKEEYKYLFHSLLSTSLNIGLINPSDIIQEVMKYKTQIHINSFEGFVRQLFWREYQRYCYIYYNFNRKNYFGNNKKLSKHWYNGTLGIPPVDNCIKKGFDTGYLHHIERLMVVGNYMNLSEIHPQDGFRWFMEFSCDAYEWVMCQNVLDMVFFVSGGATMRRPYMSSSNYIKKMSNYKCSKSGNTKSKDNEDWCVEWNKKYSKFIKKHHNKLQHLGYYVRNN